MTEADCIFSVKEICLGDEEGPRRPGQETEETKGGGDWCCNKRNITDQVRWNRMALQYILLLTLVVCSMCVCVKSVLIFLIHYVGRVTLLFHLEKWVENSYFSYFLSLSRFSTLINLIQGFLWCVQHYCRTTVCPWSRSLTGVIEQMEQFSSRLGDLSSRVESTHEHTAQGLEQGARHRDEQLRSTSHTHRRAHFVQMGQNTSWLRAYCGRCGIASGLRSFSKCSFQWCRSVWPSSRRPWRRRERTWRK